MPLTLDAAPPAASRTGDPWRDLLDRIADDVEIGTSVRVAGTLLPVPARCRLATAALAEALHARYVLGAAGALGTSAALGTSGAVRHAGREACARLVAALRPGFLGRDNWTFSYRSDAGAPSFVLTAGGGPGRAAAGCFLSLAPAVAPEVFARLVTTLDGYGVGFRAVLRGGPAAPERVEDAVITVARSHAPAVARIVLRMRDRSPLLFGSSVPAFARILAPGVGLADEPADGSDIGRHRCRVIATALVTAGPSAGPAERRIAVRRALADAGLNPRAPHLNPGSPEFRI
jgi:hypothetical protein